MTVWISLALLFLALVQPRNSSGPNNVIRLSPIKVDLPSGGPISEALDSLQMVGGNIAGPIYKEPNGEPKPQQMTLQLNLNDQLRGLQSKTELFSVRTVTLPAMKIESIESAPTRKLIELPETQTVLEGFSSNDRNSSTIPNRGLPGAASITSAVSNHSNKTTSRLSSSGLQVSADERVISGRVVIRKGLSSEGRALKVERRLMGKTLESVNVDPVTGAFHLAVEARVGSLVALLTDEVMGTVGFGEFDIGKVPKGIPALIEVLPIRSFSPLVYDLSRADALDGDVIAAGVAASVSIPSLGVSVETDSKGRASDFHIGVTGQVAIRARAEGYVDSVVLVSGDSEASQSIPMVSEPTVRALREISEVRKPATSAHRTLVLGRVTGEKRSGFRLEVESGELAQVVYFRGWLPDFSLSETAEGGQFAIFGLPPGLNRVSIRHSESAPAQFTVLTEEEAVSPVLLNWSKLAPRVRILSSFDAFLGTPLVTQLEISPESTSLVCDQMVAIAHNQPQGHSTYLFAKEVTGTYRPSVFLSEPEPGSSLFLHLPLLLSAGLDQLVHQSGEPREDRNLGSIVGFSSEGDFDILLRGARGEDFRPPVIWFNSQGAISNGPSPGGGFFIYNTPPGSWNLLSVKKAGASIDSRWLQIEPGTTTTLRLWF